MAIPSSPRCASPDPGTIKFGHAVHLKNDLRGPHGPVQLKCADCHSPAGGHMAAIDYEKHCACCHPLAIRPALRGARAAQEAGNRDRLRRRRSSREYIAAHPAEVHMADPADPRILRPPLPPARDARGVDRAARRGHEALLWRKTCVECHTLNFGGNRAEDMRGTATNCPRGVDSFALVEARVLRSHPSPDADLRGVSHARAPQPEGIRRADCRASRPAGNAIVPDPTRRNRDASNVISITIVRSRKLSMAR